MAKANSATLNFNVGVLGHIDSGKTSLAKALSSVASTASFDKNPQSKERGITLDLGFSSFSVEGNDRVKANGIANVQFTLVDCPGHASLIRTIIGGAQIIDMMMLVVDVTKGIQTQTAECLVIGEILCNKMVVVLNKVDLLPAAKKQASIEKMSKRLLKTLETTKFAGSPVLSVAAKPGGPEAPDSEAEGIKELMEMLKSQVYIPQRDAAGPFVCAVDHCFSIKGQGTVMTGTILSGSVSVNDNIELPSMKVTKKVKSMQMFRKPVDRASQGDRLGICVTQFDPKLLERGLLCAPGVLKTINAALIEVSKIPYFKSSINTKAKFHITIGHETVMGKATFFGLYANDGANDIKEKQNFDYDKDYYYQENLVPTEGGSGASGDSEEAKPLRQFAVLELERAITCTDNALVIGSKLDTDIHSNICRIAFHGRLLEAFTDTKYAETTLPKVKVYKTKQREGVVERKVDEYAVVCRGLFKKETNMEIFVGLKVKLSSGEDGVIEGSFGQSGKFKVRVPNGLSQETSQILGGKAKKGKGKGEAPASSQDGESQPINVLLSFKRYVFDPTKKMVQTR